MIILFDLLASQPITGTDFHGAGEYTKTVFNKLLTKISDNIKLEIFFNPEKIIDNVLITQCQDNNIQINYCKNNYELGILLSEKQYDIFYSALPYSYYNLNIPPKTKFIYTIHGLRSTEYPWDNYILKYKKQNFKTHIKWIISKFFPKQFYNFLRNKSIKNFNLLFSRTKNQIIITVSLHSKYSINYFFPNMNISIIEALYSPAKLLKNYDIDEKSVLDKLGIISGKYILLICGDREEKGAYRACKILTSLFESKVHKEIEDFKVIILGVTNKSAYYKLTHNSPKFIFSGYLPVPDLEVLYKNAHIFLYPTLNEGFGYPPLEAMKYNTLCVSSANSAITEICSDSILYFNPFDDSEMNIRILQSFDKDIRAEKSIKMKLRYNLISQKQEKDLEGLVNIIIGND
jgi:hypothetical protein